MIDEGNNTKTLLYKFLNKSKKKNDHNPLTPMNLFSHFAQKNGMNTKRHKPHTKIFI